MSSPQIPHDLRKEAQDAGRRAALRDLGIMGDDMEKTAILGTVGNVAGKPFQWIGSLLGKGLGRAGVGSKTVESLSQGLKSMPATMGGFGAISGALEGANVVPAALGQGDLGWDWGRAAKGFGHGALIGGAFGAGGAAYKAGLRKVLPESTHAALQAAKQPGWFGGFWKGSPGKYRGKGVLGYLFKKPVPRAGPVMAPQEKALRGLKGFGSNLALGGGAFATGDLLAMPFGGSVLGSTLLGDETQGGAIGQLGRSPHLAYPAAVAGRAAARAAGRRFGVGLTPDQLQYLQQFQGAAPWYGQR